MFRWIFMQKDQNPLNERDKLTNWFQTMTREWDNTIAAMKYVDQLFLSTFSRMLRRISIFNFL